MLTTVNALVQKLPPRDVVAGMSFAAAAGQVVDSEEADRLGGAATATCACRRCARRASMRSAAASSTSIPAGTETPLRFDFFGRQLETIRTFDAGQPAHDRQPQAHRAGADERGAAQRRGDQALPAALHRDVRRQYGRRSALCRGQRRPALSRRRALAAVLLRASGSPRRLHRRRALRLRRPGAGRPSPTGRRRSRTITRRARRPGHEEAATGGAPYKPVPPDQLYEMERHALRAGARGRRAPALALRCRRTRSGPTMPAAASRPALRPSGRRRTSTCSKRW